jgi:glycosyltransferase involved in cell wall biosynthesis
MRVGIDATCWSNRRGYGRFTRGLLQALLELETNHQFILFVDAQTYKQSHFPAGVDCIVVETSQSPTEAASATGRRSFRDLWAMTQAVARCPLDVLFFPSVYTYFPVLTKATVVLGVHDVIAEDYPNLIFPELRSRWLWNLKSWFAHRQANYILTVSQHAKHGIIRHFKHSPQRLWVIDEAPDSVFRPLAFYEINWELLDQYGLTQSNRFLLYLGGVNPHKNLGMLLESLAILHREEFYRDVQLVIVGDIHTDVFTPGLNALKTKIEILNLNDCVRFTGFIPDADIVHFFNTAQAVVLPSIAEGFGLPAMEGAACGTPVIATCNSPLPDLLIGGGIFIDPTQPIQLTEALRHILSDEMKRSSMAEAALERAKQFTWQRSAQQMHALLTQLELTKSSHK